MAGFDVNEIQELIDALAAELDKPVGLDDRSFRALAYSSQPDDIDDVRRDSILHREAPKQVTDWLEDQGISKAGSWIRIPANAELGMVGRVCLPVRFRETLLGYLWLLDDPEPLSGAELEKAQGYIVDLGPELFRARHLDSEERVREADLTRQLLLGPEDAEAAASELRSQHLVADGRLGVAILRLAPSTRVSGKSMRVRLTAALEKVRRSVAPHHFLMMINGDETCAVLLVGEDELQRRAQAMLNAANDECADLEGLSTVVGVSELKDELRDARSGYTEARDAAWVGLTVPEFSDVVPWKTIGAYRTLARIVDPARAASLIPDPLLRLLADRDAENLVPTLEVYLDNGGDAQAAAGALFIHRSSLYNRLHRIEDIAGVDLSSGEDRLEIHLGLRIWRMSGSRWPPESNLESDARAGRLQAAPVRKSQQVR